LVEQARLLSGLGAAVRIRTLSYESSRWRTLVGGVPVDALREHVSRRPPRNLPRSPSDARMTWLLDDLAGADLAIAHHYPASSALGAASGAGVRIWYCHEPPRGLYPSEVSPFLHANAERAPSRHGPRYYRKSMNSWFGGLPLIGRRRASRLEADRRGIRGLDAVWANSEFTRDNVRRVYGSLDVAVVYPTVAVAPNRASLGGSRRDGLKVLCLTRLEWVKNLDTLLEGFALFQRREDPHAELHVVGEGRAGKALRRQVARLGLGKAVELHGFLDEEAISELSARCDAFACLPLDEPFGMVFPEAMARGLLVLGPDHGGPLEILDGGRLGEIADPLSPEAIAEGLSRLRRLPDAEADRRRSAAALAARQRYSREATAAQVTSLLGRHGVKF
jgi:glycosyltransferase involved in cell wall biosynthesis